VTPTMRFHAALAYASQLHQDDVRKSTGIPYVTHLLGVCAIVLTNGGSETEAIAALLHDAAEDQGGEPQLDRIGALFGADVAAIVRGCSDSLVDTSRGAKKAPWRERKRAYLEHLRAENDPAVLLVAAADKLDNLRALVRDLGTHGAALWTHFAGGATGTVWNYRALVDVLAGACAVEPRLVPIIDEARALLAALPDPDATALERLGLAAG
jgi:(p)ppGpp synthase/HD superfamily hydrolase